MPELIARKRHLKKVLDRWENEGGNMPDHSTSAPQSASPDSHLDKGKPISKERAAKTSKSNASR